jgi:hypothetical protein
MNGDDFAHLAQKVESLSDSEYADLTSQLYREIYNYHHPSRWVDEIGRVVYKIKKEIE